MARNERLWLRLAVGGNRTQLEALESAPGVESVIAIAHTFKLVSRQVKPERTVVNVGGMPIGGGHVVVIAGPCSVELREQVLTTARAVKAADARLLRGGAYKLRTSPYYFQGLGEEALSLLAEARAETGLPIVTEVLSTDDVEVIASMPICCRWVRAICRTLLCCDAWHG